MALDLDAAAWIRAGSGLLWMALGAAILALAREARGRTMGFTVTAVGAHFAVFNVTFTDTSLQLVAVTLSPAILAAGGLASAALAWQLAPTRGARRLVAIYSAGALVGGGLFLAYTLAMDVPVTTEIDDPVADRIYRWTSALFVLGQTALVALPAVLAWHASIADAPAASLVAIAVALYAAFHAGDGLAESVGRTGPMAVATGAYFGPYLLAVLGACAAWLVVSRGAHARPARNVSIVLAGAALLGALFAALELRGALGGTVGILRTIAGALIAIAVFRRGFLQLPLTRLVASRGALAAGALAALFIVAQIAQNFLSAEYGLLTGGIAAGAFLFAAQPLQRAMERLSSERHSTPVLVTGGNASDEDIYRNALRVALRDKRLTRDEEVHLHRLATRLGIPGDRAHELLVEVERERAP